LLYSFTLYSHILIYSNKYFKKPSKYGFYMWKFRNKWGIYLIFKAL